MIDKRAERETHRFDIWMRFRVRSIYYTDNSRMVEAYKRVYDNIATTS